MYTFMCVCMHHLNSFFTNFFLKKHYLWFQIEGEREKKGEALHLLVHFPKTTNSQGGPSRPRSQVSHLGLLYGGQDQEVLWSSTAVFSCHRGKELVGSGVSKTGLTSVRVTSCTRMPTPSSHLLKCLPMLKIMHVKEGEVK